MNRFFVEEINPLDKYIILDDPQQVHHLKDVLRLKINEEAAVFDGLGNEYIVGVDDLGSKSVRLEIKNKRPAVESGIKITVVCAIPKNVKMDDIIDKLTQLGVECIIPLETERVIVRLDKQKKLERLKRWEKISISAVKQSGRAKFVKIQPVLKFKEAILEAANFDLKLIPTLDGPRKTLKEIFDNPNKKIESIILLIGPEGDFTAGEVALAKDVGFLPVSLGSGVLRVDTAAIAAVSFIKLNEAR